MAKQNPATDPVSAAMSAIESALNLTDDDEAGRPPAIAVLRPSSFRAKATTATPVLKPSPLAAEASTLLRPEPLVSGQRCRERGKADASRPPRRQTMTARPSGAILQAMNARPASRTPFVLAVIGSLLWAAICALYGYVAPVALDPGAPARAACCVPRRRSSCWRRWRRSSSCSPLPRSRGGLGELRQSARAISQVAVRLAEPETTAGEHMANLSQAIRRELTSMGDGVERALARAAELETRVQSEVSTLERSYSDNERRIRLLIAEMADQRESIVTSGTRVRDAIANAHDGIAAGPQFRRRQSERAPDRSRPAAAASLGASSEDDRPGPGPRRVGDARAHRRRRRADERIDRRDRR